MAGGRYDLLLVDGSHLAFRTFHTHKELGAKIGGRFVGTGIAFGSLNSLIGIVKERLIVDNPQVIVAWDRGRDRRVAIFPAYKGNRDGAWDEYENFSAQRSVFQRVAPFAGMTQVFKKGEEADDVIGTLAKTKGEKGVRTLILTGDHDYFQLVRENVHILRPKQKGGDIIYDPKRVKEEFGIEARSFINVMALVGDPGDNIPGIKGIGEKTAVKLLQEDPTIVLQCLETDFPNISVKSANMKTKILANVPAVRLAHLLSKIVTDIEGLTYINKKRDLRGLKQRLEMLKCQSLLEGEKWDTLLRLV